MIMDESEVCFGKLAYEHRVVAFFDILGWKSEVAGVGEDPRWIARLAAAAVRMFNANAAKVGDAGLRRSQLGLAVQRLAEWRVRRTDAATS